MLRLRPYKKCDAETIVSWFKDEETFYKWSAGRLGSYPLLADTLIRHYEEQEYTENFFPMTAFDEDGIAGHLLLRFPTEDKRILRFGFVVVDGTKRGRGYGKEMLTLALTYAFTILKAEKVTIGVFENNLPARHCYYSLGFKETSVTEDYAIAGRLWKCIELEITPAYSVSKTDGYALP